MLVLLIIRIQTHGNVYSHTKNKINYEAPFILKIFLSGHENNNLRKIKK